ncbi:MAG: transposase, partial [Planctomycetota bacterium]
MRSFVNYHRQADPQVWVMDEHRVGLKPILRRVWSLPGQRPMAPVEHRYDWLYVYGFVRPLTGRTFWLLMPTVSIATFSVALQHFMDFIDPSAHTAVRLLVDQAAYHVSRQVTCPPHLRLWFLPAYSPELQPAEHLWELVDQ